jgi:hypothetical protein
VTSILSSLIQYTPLLADDYQPFFQMSPPVTTATAYASPSRAQAWGQFRPLVPRPVPTNIRASSMQQSEDEYDDLDLDAADLAEISEFERAANQGGRDHSRLQGGGNVAVGRFSQSVGRYLGPETTRFDTAPPIGRPFDSGSGRVSGHPQRSINGVRLVPTSTLRLYSLDFHSGTSTGGEADVLAFSLADWYRGVFAFPAFNAMQSTCFDAVGRTTVKTLRRKTLKRCNQIHRSSSNVVVSGAWPCPEAVVTRARFRLTVRVGAHTSSYWRRKDGAFRASHNEGFRRCTGFSSRLHVADQSAVWREG